MAHHGARCADAVWRRVGLLRCGCATSQVPVDPQKVGQKKGGVPARIAAFTRVWRGVRAFGPEEQRAQAKAARNEAAIPERRAAVFRVLEEGGDPPPFDEDVLDRLLRLRPHQVAAETARMYKEAPELAEQRAEEQVRNDASLQDTAIR